MKCKYNVGKYLLSAITAIFILHIDISAPLVSLEGEHVKISCLLPTYLCSPECSDAASPEAAETFAKEEQ